jgi:hypothetical protein
VHHHDVVLGGQGCDRSRGDPYVPPLHLCRHRVTATQQRVAAKGEHDAHTGLLPGGDSHPSPERLLLILFRAALRGRHLSGVILRGIAFLISAATMTESAIAAQISHC